MIMVGFSLWLVVNVWATSFVSRKVKNADHRIAYLALIWCLPLFGAIAASTIAAHHSMRKAANSSAKMLSAISETQKRSRE